MKKLTTIAALLLSCAALVSAAPTDTLKLLCIGNSFSVDAVENNLHEISEAGGHNMVIGNLYIGGCSLQTHLENATGDLEAYSYRKIAADGTRTTRSASLSSALAEEKWDVVTFQQASHFSGLPETYEPYLTDLIKYVREHSGRDVRLMMHQTWAYAIGSTHGAFHTYNFDQKYMYDALCNAYRTEAARHHLEVIPCGTAVQNSRTTYNGENVTRDGFHLHLTFGRYMAACTFYEAIYGESVVGNAFAPDNLQEYRRQIAQVCAHNACLHPWEVTPAFPNQYGYEASLKAVGPRRPYTLPDPLIMADGRKVTSPEMWYSERRPELVSLFEAEMFGKAPGKIEGTTFTVVEEDRKALGGTAIRKQIRVDFGRKGMYVNVLMYLPSSAEGKVPVFLGCNFNGNATISDDPAIFFEENPARFGIYHKAERGSSSSSWPVADILSRGYGLVTFCKNDLDPDFDDSFKNGVTSLIYSEGQTYPHPDQWGAISAWAWGMSRVLDYLETDSDVDAQKVAVIGHSRLGKTALLAGARDERFAMAISNCSGCGGAALSRRQYGETVEAITRTFPHWFCGNFSKYAGNEDSLPFDQHEFLALMAPRPVYVASAEDDAWADPVGERLALQEAQKVYDFLGLERGLTGYHIRQGGHALTAEDWNHYMDFADIYL